MLSQFVKVLCFENIYTLNMAVNLVRQVPVVALALSTRPAAVNFLLSHGSTDLTQSATRLQLRGVLLQEISAIESERAGCQKLVARWRQGRRAQTRESEVTRVGYMSPATDMVVTG